MGRSRGGLTTKIHALVDACGLLVSFILSEGQEYDGHYARQLIEHVLEGNMVLADRAYNADAIRNAIAERGAWANIPPMSQRRFKSAFSKHLYKARNLFERFFNKIKHFRAVATRYDKHPESYLAMVKPASIRIWMRFNESVT